MGGSEERGSLFGLEVAWMVIGKAIFVTCN